MTIALLGGVIGIALAKAFTLGGDPTHGMLPLFYLPIGRMFLGTAAALTVGALAACCRRLAPAACASWMPCGKSSGETGGEKRGHSHHLQPA